MKLHIVTPVAADAQAWSAALQRADHSFELATEPRGLNAAKLQANGSKPDVLIAQATEPSDLAALEVLATAHPEVDCLLVTGELSSETLLRLMRAGVREVLPAPATADAVVAAVQRLARKRKPHLHAGAVAQHQGATLGVLTCKGGSGATFVAANLAHLLARNGQRRVALVDLNLQFGDAALFVTSEHSASNVADVARNIHRLDRELLQSAMTPAGAGLWVLAAPDDPAQASDVLPEHVQAILALAATMFDHVVIDLGRTISAVTLRALDACQHVYVVLQQTLPFIRDGRRLSDALRTLDYPADKISWIVNRYEQGGDISLADVKRALGVSQLLTLPNQYEVVASSVNQGVPVDRLAPRSAIARALRELADSIAPIEAAPRAGRWLSGLFRGTAP